MPTWANGRENLLLAALPTAEHRSWVASCDAVNLVPGTVLCEQGDRTPNVYFPAGSTISTMRRIDKNQQLEVGHVGARDMLGIWIAWDVNPSPTRAIVLGGGAALRMEANTFSLQLQRSPALDRELKRYTYCLMSQLAQMAVCARYHLIEARLARTLLMISDGTRSDELSLTHEFIASLLGVRRVSVTEAARSLQTRQMISYCRGTVSILDRNGLQDASCNCYRSNHETYGQVTNSRRLRMLRA